MTFKEYRQLDEIVINPATVLGVKKIIDGGKFAYKYLSANKVKKVADKVLGKNKIGPNSLVKGTRLRNFLKGMNIEPDLIALIIAFLAGAATVILLMLIFSVGKNVKNIVTYINNKYKLVKDKFKKEVDDKDVKLISTQLKAA